MYDFFLASLISLFIHSHSFSRTCPNRGMFHGRIRPFYFSSIYYNSISVCGQYIGYIYLEKILIFEKILLYICSIWIYKKGSKNFSYCKLMFAFMWGGWIKMQKKYILPDNLDRIFVKIVKKDLFRIYGIGKNGVSIVMFG